MHISQFTARHTARIHQHTYKHIHMPTHNIHECKTYTHEFVLDCYYKDVTLPSANLSYIFILMKNIIIEGRKISSSENSVKKNSLDIVMYYWLVWWLRELFENKEGFHKGSKIQKI